MPIPVVWASAKGIDSRATVPPVAPSCNSRPDSPGKSPRSRSRDVAQAAARAPVDRPALREPRPVVAHRDTEHPAVAARGNLQQAGVEPSSEAVDEGILDQRLEDQVRHQRAAGVGRDPADDTQPVAEADLFDRQVGVGERQFLVEGDELAPAGLHGEPQERAETLDDRAGRVGVAGRCQGGDGVQRVEQEVRLELELQPVELCGSQGASQFRLAQLLLRLLSREVDHRGDPDDQPVDRRPAKAPGAPPSGPRGSRSAR